MQEQLISLIEKFNERHILIIGDMIADIYLTGNIARISREAPVLILEQAAEKIVPGGAANVVNNVATLGGSVAAIGVLGEDQAKEGLCNIFEERKVDISGFVVDNERPTITKTRIIAGGRATVSQQIVRIDNESKESLSKVTKEKLIEQVNRLLPTMDAVVLSDYGSGTVFPELVNLVINYAKLHGIVTIVDSRYNIKAFKNIDYVKQNDAELSAAVGRELSSEDDIISAASELLKELSAKGVLITRGEKGMMLFEDNGNIHNIPVTDKSEVFDVSGAGDTCVATLILALAAGEKPRNAAYLSNIASGIAVRKQGTATVSGNELKANLRHV